MARFNQNRKRSGGPMFRSGNVKRRRTMRRRRPFARRSNMGGLARSNQFTSQSGIGSGLRYRARKQSISLWRKKLWDATLFKKHYRSVRNTTASVATPVLQNQATIEFSNALRLGSNDFYTTAGGAFDPDGLTVPTFVPDDDIVIRGGKITLRICNKHDTEANADPLDVRVYLIRSGRNYSQAGLITTQAVNWDPSMFIDFQTNLGRIVYNKKFLLRDEETASIEYRLKIQKIDQTDYQNGRLSYHWIMVVSNPDTVGARQLQYTTGYSLSFTGDAIN